MFPILNSLLISFNQVGIFPSSEIKLLAIIDKKRSMIFEEVPSEPSKHFIYRDGFYPIYVYIEISRFSWVKITYYNLYGKIHRDNDKPAEIYFVKTRRGLKGSIEREEFYKDGEYHRDGDNPAIITYNPQGKIVQEQYYKNNNFIKELNIEEKLQDSLYYL